MCLTINTIINPGYKPIKLEHDLHVIKYLNTSKTNFFGKKIIETPFQRHRVRFIFGKCVLKAKFSKVFSYYVEKGIHSLLERDFNYEVCGYCSFNAIIPKGTLVYYGNDKDIASEKLIILEN